MRFLKIAVQNFERTLNEIHFVRFFGIVSEKSESQQTLDYLSVAAFSGFLMSEKSEKWGYPGVRKTVIFKSLKHRKKKSTLRESSISGFFKKKFIGNWHFGKVFALYNCRKQKKRKQKKQEIKTMEKRQAVIVKAGSTLYGKVETVEAKRDIPGIYVKALDYGFCMISIKSKKFKTDFFNLMEA